MSKSPKPVPSVIASPSFFAALERAVFRMEGRLGAFVKGGAFAGAMTFAAAPTVAGCLATTDRSDEPLGEAEEAVLANGQSDWAQQQGQRNTSMVRYYQESWWSWNYTTCSSRFCPQYIDVFLKLAVRPVAGANLDQKRVGVVYRAPGSNELTTVTGNYFTTWNDGDEEWHIKVTVPSSQVFLSFNAWYQDGAGNTFYDDNVGELHAVTAGPTSIAVVQMGGDPFTTVSLDETGVHGSVSARLMDVDYDKQVDMVYTLDNWQTSHWLSVGTGDNAWHWVEDYGQDYERWTVDLDLPGDFQEMQYAIRYRHGVVNGAHAYEFWDNHNGQNYVVSRPSE